MFTTTPDQKYLLSVLDATKTMRRDQAARLLAKLRGEHDEAYAARCLWQLRHIRKIAWKTGGVFSTPMLSNEPTDGDMLSAIDVMLDLTDRRVLSASQGPAPYKLRFLSERGNGLGQFAVVVFNAGAERSVAAALPTAPDGHAVIFLLPDLSHKARVKTSLPHYFAIRDGSRLRYFGNFGKG